MQQRHGLVIGGVAGFLGVLAGTFGAHVLAGRIDQDLLDTFEVGVRYHMYHALAILAVAALPGRTGRAAAVTIGCFAAGIVVFAGSLYLLAVTGQRWLGAVTPVGGVLLLAGWIGVIFAARRPAGAVPSDP